MILKLGSREIDLSKLRPLELRVLRYLADAQQRVVSEAELLESVWGYDASTRTRTVGTTLARLRRKIEEDPKNPVFLLTIRGKGFVLRTEASRVSEPLEHRRVEMDWLVDWFSQPSARLVTLLGGSQAERLVLAQSAATRVGGRVLLDPSLSDVTRLLGESERLLVVADRPLRLMSEATLVLRPAADDAS